jgi:hypothetical protein
MLQRGLAGAAGVIMACAICAAVLQLAIMILGLPRPAAITMITLAALTGLNWLRRHLRVARHRFAPRNPHSIHR